MIQITWTSAIVLFVFGSIGSTIAQAIMWRFLADNPEHEFGFREAFTRVYWFTIGQVSFLVAVAVLMQFAA